MSIHIYARAQKYSNNECNHPLHPRLSVYTFQNLRVFVRIQKFYLILFCLCIVYIKIFYWVDSNRTKNRQKKVA